MTIILLLLIPLLASGATLLLSSVRRMEELHLLSAVGAFGAAIGLAAEVLRHGPVSVGNGFLYADPLSALVVLLTAFVYLVTAPYAVG